MNKVENVSVRSNRLGILWVGSLFHPRSIRGMCPLRDSQRQGCETDLRALFLMVHAEKPADVSRADSCTCCPQILLTWPEVLCSPLDSKQ